METIVLMFLFFSRSSSELSNALRILKFYKVLFELRLAKVGANFFRILSNILNKTYKICPNLLGKIGFRLSGNDYVNGGFDIKLVKALVKKLDKFKVMATRTEENSQKLKQI